VNFDGATCGTVRRALLEGGAASARRNRIRPGGTSSGISIIARRTPSSRRRGGGAADDDYGDPTLVKKVERGSGEYIVGQTMCRPGATRGPPLQDSCGASFGVLWGSSRRLGWGPVAGYPCRSRRGQQRASSNTPASTPAIARRIRVAHETERGRQQIEVHFGGFTRHKRAAVGQQEISWERSQGTLAAATCPPDGRSGGALIR